jgi:hypothetical protein
LILDLLSATGHERANEWRAACRERTARPRPRKGQQVTFGEPIAFTDGKECSSFTFEGGVRFLAADGTRVRISRWQQRDYTIT